MNTLPKRDNKGRFTKTGAAASDVTLGTSGGQTPPLDQTPPSEPFTPTAVSGKETQPNFEEVYLEDAEKTKELKEQIAELEKKAEVKEIKGEIELPEMVKKQGVEVVGEEVPVPTQPSITLPLDDQKIYTLVKKFKKLHKNVTDSIVWLALWCWRQFQLAHIKLKEIHGKIIRQAG